MTVVGSDDLPCLTWEQSLQAYVGLVGSSVAVGDEFQRMAGSGASFLSPPVEGAFLRLAVPVTDFFYQILRFEHSR